MNATKVANQKSRKISNNLLTLRKMWFVKFVDRTSVLSLFFLRVLWSERGDDFLKARIAAERIPKPQR
jgi:hypothetical protein